MSAKRTVLIIGAGEVGAISARKLIEHQKADRLILHTSKAETMHARMRELQEVAKGSVVIEGSYGDIFAPAALMKTARAQLDDPQVQLALVEHFLAPPSEAVLRNSAIYELVKTHRPDVIIDAVNSATVCMYGPNPSHAYSQLLETGRQLVEGSAPERAQQVVMNTLLSLYIPVLTRYVEALHLAMQEFRVSRFIKISTTGLGGMGFNCPYTHGSQTDIGLSPALVAKLAGSGALHQMLWNLSHTDGFDVRLVVPAALIGWEQVRIGSYKSRGRVTMATDCKAPLALSFDQALQVQPNKSTQEAEMVYVPAGDNSTYSLQEMAVSTALGQFESITKEEVGLAVMETVEGSTRYDLLSQMDMASLPPSYLAANKRRMILDQMKRLEASSGMPSIASGNLGPTISKLLFELHVVQAATGSLSEAAEADPAELSATAHRYLLANDYVRQQILSLGLPVLAADDQFFVGSELAVPDATERDLPVTPELVEKWAAIGWVDIRPQRMAYWQQCLRDVLAREDELSAIIGRTGEFESGELLACIFRNQQKARRIRY